jgi:Immunoglobulin-like domain of bacterial spore germination
MRIRLLTLGALVSLAAACGGGERATTVTTTVAAPPPPPPSATTTAQVPVDPAPLALTVFRVDNGVLRPRVVHVPRSAAVATAALGALDVGARVTIDTGTATVALDQASQDEQAEIVYTLTQFASIKRVDVAGRTGLTRDDFASYVPPILVETPAAGATVTPTFRVAGTASVFEATLVVQLVRDGKVLEKQTVTASEGAPGRGTFETTLHATPGAATVSAFSPSAANGEPQHRVDVEVNVGA